MSFVIHCGDALTVLKTLPSDSIDCCVTSPPYWGLRDYGIEPQVWDGRADCIHEWGEWRAMADVREETSSGKSRTTERFFGDESRRFNGNHQKHTAGAFCQICGAWRGSFGLEPTPELYIQHAISIFREVRRVIKGTLWLNIGDSYNAHPGQRTVHDKVGTKQLTNRGSYEAASRNTPTLKPKDLVGIPWMLAFALRADGWWLRQEIIWHKPNPMPESVQDRPTRAHEQLFLLAKSERYFYDAEAIKEQSVTNDPRRPYGSQGAWDMDGRPIEQRHGGKIRDFEPLGREGVNSRMHQDRDPNHSGDRKFRSGDSPRIHGNLPGRDDGGAACNKPGQESRNKRSVWTVATQPTPEAHFATYPIALIEPCILAGCPVGGTVLDPFCGAGTTGMAALKHGREFIGIELNPKYVEITRSRLVGKIPLFAQEFINTEATAAS